MKGRWGITGERLGVMEGTAEVQGREVVLIFTTGQGSKVTLELHDGKYLVGTFNSRGSGQRLQDRPIRLQKVE